MLRSSTQTIRASLTLTQWRRNRIKFSRKRLRRMPSQKARSICYSLTAKTTLAISPLILDLNNLVPFQDHLLIWEVDSVCKVTRDSKANRWDNRDLWVVDSSLRCRKWIVASNQIQCNSSNLTWCSIRTKWVVACNRCRTNKWDSIQAWCPVVWISSRISQCSLDSSLSSTCNNNLVWCPKWTNSSRIKDRVTLALCKDDWYSIDTIIWN